MSRLGPGVHAARHVAGDDGRRVRPRRGEAQGDAGEPVGVGELAAEGLAPGLGRPVDVGWVGRLGIVRGLPTGGPVDLVAEHPIIYSFLIIVWRLYGEPYYILLEVR